MNNLSSEIIFSMFKIGFTVLFSIISDVINSFSIYSILFIVSSFTLKISYTSSTKNPNFTLLEFIIITLLLLE